MTSAPRRHPRRRPRLALPATLAALVVATNLTSAAAADAGSIDADHRPPAQPDIARLAGPLADQRIDWRPCTASDGVPDELAARPGVSCGRITVPRDWHHPDDGATLSIGVSQVHHLDTDDPAYRGTIVTNPGGPGLPGASLGPELDRRAPRLASSHNIVSFDPRGAGFTDVASLPFCQVPAAPAPGSEGDPYWRERAVGSICSADPLISKINTEQTAYDMELLRHVMSLRTIDYLGYSYGTWLGAWYAKLFPASAGQVVLDSAMDSTQRTLQSTWELQPRARDRQFRLHLLPWIARQDATYRLGTDPVALLRRYLRAAARLGDSAVGYAWRITGAVNAFPRNEDYPKAGALVAAVIASGEDPSIPLPGTATSLATAARIVTTMATLPGAGDADELRATARALQEVSAMPSAVTDDGAPDSPPTVPFFSPFDYIRCNDGQWTQGPAYWEAERDRLRTEAPVSTQLGVVDIPYCAFWPTANAMPRAPRRFPDTLVLQSELDSQTGYEGGYSAATRLPHTKGIVIDNEGSHAHFPYGTPCVDEPIYRFLETGRRPVADITTCQAKALPRESTTYESWTRLDRRGRPTTPVTSPFVVAEPRTGRGDTHPSLLDLGEQRQERSRLAEEIRREYGERAVHALGLDDPA